MMPVLLLYVIFSAAAVSNVDGESFASPGRYRCRLSDSSDGLVADCSALGLHSIPIDLPDAVTELLIAHNEIRYINTTSFRHLPRLRKLNMDQNGLNSIQKGTFDSLLSLQELALSQNSLIELPSDLFHRNQELEIVDFTQNLFSSVPILALRHATGLKNVILISNKITTLNFTGLQSLDVEKIDLSIYTIRGRYTDSCSFYFVSCFLE